MKGKEHTSYYKGWKITCI